MTDFDVPRDTTTCGRCGGTMDETDFTELAGWMGVNWDEGVKVHFECRECGGTGAITKRDDATGGRAGACAQPIDERALGAQR